MKKTTHLLVCTAFALCTLHGPTLFAQGDLPTSSALQRAIVVEEIEHDARQALALYLELSQDSGAPDAVRRHAALRLGRGRALLGDLEGAKQALGLAAVGDDAIARLARKELQDPGADSQRARLLNEEARRWIELTRPSNRPSDIRTDEAPKNLLALGVAAVPELIRAIEAEPHSIKASLFGALLWRIGGDEAAAYLTRVLTDPDVELRRQMARGLMGDNAWQERMIAIAEKYLADSDPSGRVQIRALGAITGNPGHSLVRRYQVQALLPLIDSEVPDVRAAALVRISSYWGALLHNGQQIPNADILAAGIELALDDVHAEVRKAAQYSLSKIGLQSPASRALLVRRLPSMSQDFELLSPTSIPTSTEQATIDGLFPMLLELGPIANPMTRRDKGAASLVEFYLDTLDKDSLELVLASQRLGYLHRLSTIAWVERTCGARETERVLEAILESPAIRYLLRWCTQFPLSARSEERLIAIGQALLEERGPYDWVDFDEERFNLRVALGRVGTKTALARIMQGLGDAVPQRLYRSTTQAVLHASARRQDADVLAALRYILVFGRDRSKNFAQRTASARQRVLARLVELGDLGTVPLFAKAVEYLKKKVPLDGAYPSTSPFRDAQGFNYSWLFLNHLDGKQRVFFHGYGADRVAQVWDALLQAERPTTTPNPWQDMAKAITVDGSGSNRWFTRSVPEVYGQLSPGLVQVFARNWTRRVAVPGDSRVSEEFNCLVYLLDILRLELLTDPSSASALGDLRRACFASSVYEYRALAIDMLPRVLDKESDIAVRAALSDPEHSVARRAAQRTHPEVRPYPAELFAVLLKSSSSAVRGYAIYALAPLVEGDPVPLVGKLLGDSDGLVRERACRFLETRADMRMVPELITALRDSNSRVRTAAADALRAIRFYHDEKAHWDRVFAGTELSQGGAASTLLKQAAAESPREIRLLAIRSLGTLGEPQTLPFLIEWTADGDAQIAAQARAAIGLIHTTSEVK